MFRKQRLSFLLCIVVAGMLISCSSNYKFASSFGKRKYLKGYYLDVPAETKEVVSASSSDKPSIPPIANNTLGHIYLTDQVITLKNNRSITIISGKNTNSIPAISKGERHSSKQGKEISQPAKKEINNIAPPTDGTKFADSKHEVNLWAILGCSLSIIGAVLTAISGSFTLLSVIVLAIAGIICIYSLFQNKFYYTWLSIIGLTTIIFILVLILY
ncbi:MAG TPA: hypothetical protein VNZ45_10060 [Bacteroidia bacterium]|jgi:hypothetical protein|nr:hypothetical protein [Bacteroidia bacterium]